MHPIYAAERIMQSEYKSFGSHCIIGRWVKYASDPAWAFHAAFEDGEWIHFQRFILRYRGLFWMRFSLTISDELKLPLLQKTDFLKSIEVNDNEFNELTKIGAKSIDFWSRGDDDHLLIQHNSFRRKWKSGWASETNMPRKLIGDVIHQIEKSIDGKFDLGNNSGQIWYLRYAPIGHAREG